MGPVGRRQERRAIRHAADQALTTPIFTRPGAVAVIEPGPPSGVTDQPQRSYASEISVRPVAYRRTPWFRARKVVSTLAVVAVAAIAVWGIVHVLRSPGGTAEVSTTVVPQPTTSAASAAPAATSAGPTPSVVPPPVPLPPPAPTASQIVVPPADTGQNYWPRSAPTQTAKPEIGVTRTPVTRAPISATPPAYQSPGSDSSAPGDAPKRRGGWPF